MTKDLTTGKIMPILIRFTIPLVLGNLFQLTYNAVDSIIVGHFVGKEALAAVGICNPISTLMILFLNGLCIAINTEPDGFNLTEVFFKASSLIDSGILVIYPSFKSPVFSQGIVPL